MEKAKIVTPHIAGYSLEGKVNGTIILYNALCNFLNVSPTWRPQLPAVNEEIIISDSDIQQSLQKIFSKIYKIEKDDLNMREIERFDPKEKEIYFDTLRKNYLLRREFPNYRVRLNYENNRLKSILNAFRFNIEQ